MIETITSSIPKDARWYDIIEVKGTSTPISFKNNRIHSINQRQNTGYGFRININGTTGFSYTNNYAHLKGAIERAVKSSPMGDEEQFELPCRGEKEFEPYDGRTENFSIDNEIHQAQHSIDKILKRYPTATVDLGINNSSGSMRLINSGGLDLSYNNSYYSASISATLIEDDGTKIDVWESVSSLYPSVYEDLHKRIIDKIELASVQKKLGSGKVTVILTPKALARIISIVTAGLNAKSVWKGISPFVNKIGERIFNESFTLLDDPLKKDSPFSYPFDDEGVTARKKPLISGGTVERYITDLKCAWKLGIEPEGNGSRGYSTLPSPSYSNLTIDKGTEPYEEMVKGVKKGILIEQFIGLGQSNTLTGDFSTNLDLAFLIEKGEVSGRVKDCMISDNLFRLLAGEIQLSKDLETRGSITVPYILFPEVNFTE